MVVSQETIVLSSSAYMFRTNAKRDLRLDLLVRVFATFFGLASLSPIQDLKDQQE